MSRGILQLAVRGKLPLQLVYQALEIPLEDLPSGMEISEAADRGSLSFMSGSFELIYAEY
ncbi:MAG TPA: hypothetical protein VK466_01430 [Terriglobales bacterium]|nr:hypothetical protein [Terriglobales bacterium]